MWCDGNKRLMNPHHQSFSTQKFDVFFSRYFFAFTIILDHQSCMRSQTVKLYGNRVWAQLWIFSTQHKHSNDANWMKNLNTANEFGWTLNPLHDPLPAYLHLHLPSNSQWFIVVAVVISNERRANFGLARLFPVHHFSSRTYYFV